MCLEESPSGVSSLDAWLRGLANCLIRAKQAVKYCLEGRKKG
jgi:hypothetical protein